MSNDVKRFDCVMSGLIWKHDSGDMWWEYRENMDEYQKVVCDMINEGAIANGDDVVVNKIDDERFKIKVMPQKGDTYELEASAWDDE